MNNIIKRKWNQNSMVIIEDLQGMAFQTESGGHTFQISGIDGEGNTVALSGTPAGVMLRADGQDVTLTCSVSGGVVFATLPANAYSVPGRFGLTIFLTSDGQKTAIYAAVGTVGKTSSGTVAPPAGSDVVDLVNAIATAVATIPASYTDLMASVAPTYSSSGLYAVGSYAWYNGKLYRCTTPITSGETWTSGHWTLANIGSDLVDLKSALNNEIDQTQDGFDVRFGDWYYEATSETISFVETASHYVNRNGQSVSSGTYKYGTATIEPLEKLTISGEADVYVPLCVFFDEDDNVCGFYPETDPSSQTRYDNFTIIAPSNAVKICINRYSIRTISISGKSIINLKTITEGIYTQLAGKVSQSEFGNEVNRSLIKFGDNLYNDLTLVSSTITSGKFVTRAGVEASTSDWKYAKATVHPLSKLKVSGTSQQAAPLLVFLDSSNNVVSFYPVAEDSQATRYVDEVIYTPINATQIIVNDFTIRSPLVKEGTLVSVHEYEQENDEKISAVFMADYTPLDLTSFPNDGFMNYNNGNIDVIAGYYHAVIDVEEGEEYKISGYAYLAIKTAVVTDGTNVLLSFPTTEANPLSYVNGTIKIPAGGTKLYLNYMYAGGDNIQYYVSCYKRTGNTVNVGEEQKISVIGDSLSAGFSIAGIRYLNLLEAHDNYKVENLSRNGHGYKRDDDNRYAFWKQAQRVSSDTDICLVFGSFNDLTLISNIGDKTDTGTSTICGCVNTTFDNIYAISDGIKIGVILPTPWTANRPGSENSDLYISKIIEVCELRGIPYLDLYHKSQMRPWETDFNTAYYCNADGTHPNNAGHKLFIYPAVKEFIKTLKAR